ncbi:cytochrome P450 [Burkholderia sp. FERM BP-3421]|jgi:cytochrome P450|uniref:cytochrome P450 n=1 Tax=Burkholderia sp. FERM BP-3421 TaxID=1494466 RepID=UPI00235FBDBD|nr:cytochrome P450 [Burkholderia sp. FERM BP-3421]WDD91549.1 cytochrome P450 [Burkholderia sp. FERM BP-3421]
MQYSDLSTPAYLDNPYPVLDAMRDEALLVQLAPRLYATSHYAFGEKLLLDRRFGKGIVEAVKARYGEGVIDQPPFRTFRAMLPGLNPPKHTHLRALIMKSFNARQIEKFREASYAISNQLVDKLAREPQGDLVSGFAFVLPMQTICTILDVPLSDGAMFKKAADKAAGALNVTPLNAEQLEESKQSALQLEAYFARVLAERRKHPGDDLISQMILAEENGERLTDDEIVANLCFLFVAGHETTENMIGNSLIALQRHPEQRERVKADPSLMPNVVNECLRFDSSVQIAQRVALEDIEIDGYALKRGDLICVCLGGANRDPQQFEDPNTLNIDREGVRPLSFGNGLHYCLGARLATLEIAAALETIYARLPNLHITNLDALPYRRNNALRGVDSLLATW